MGQCQLVIKKTIQDKIFKKISLGSTKGIAEKYYRMFWFHLNSYLNELHVSVLKLRTVIRFCARMQTISLLYFPLFF